jgi:hypothetical protein
MRKAIHMISLIVSGIVVVAAQMTLQLLPVGEGACNDGSQAGVYSHRTPYQAKRIILFLQGGGFCFDANSCNARWQQWPDGMSSKNWSTNAGLPSGGLLSLNESDLYYFRYCSSDSWSGNTSLSPRNGFVFQGGQIVRSAVKRLIDFSRSRDVIFAGASAGAEGIYPHADWLQTMLGSTANVRVLSDSGFFLDCPPYYNGNCADLGSCTEQGALQRGVKLWSPMVDDSCRSVYASSLWQCMIGVYAAAYVELAALFLLQFRFDAAQLGHDGVYHKPASKAEIKYAGMEAANVTSQLKQGKLEWVARLNDRSCVSEYCKRVLCCFVLSSHNC